MLWTVALGAIQTLTYRTIGWAGVWYGLAALGVIVLFFHATAYTTTIILSVAYLIALCIAVVPLSIEKNARQPLEDVCSRIASNHGLTPREQEIFIYLAQGRNRPYIQEKLHLADGTIRTHSSHIYDKLEVHTRQEMLDLVESYAAKDD
ncbi:MAG: LuxR C-terminal-related transcriptional regulator, partial [Coriobacteriaceae bacterium]|jgi:DNA-binding CsgD family transcriptional regulator|nr:LuxR C-terminal-related transcriptional regulator [Coriobacteriaceae bacterium]